MISATAMNVPKEANGRPCREITTEVTRMHHNKRQLDTMETRPLSPKRVRKVDPGSTRIGQSQGTEIGIEKHSKPGEETIQKKENAARPTAQAHATETSASRKLDATASPRTQADMVESPTDSGATQNRRPNATTRPFSQPREAEPLEDDHNERTMQSDSDARRLSRPDIVDITESSSEDEVVNLSVDVTLTSFLFWGKGFGRYPWEVTDILAASVSWVNASNQLQKVLKREFAGDLYNQAQIDKHLQVRARARDKPRPCLFAKKRRKRKVEWDIPGKACKMCRENQRLCIVSLDEGHIVLPP